MDAALWHWRAACNTHCWWGHTSIAILHGCYWAIPKLWQIIIQMTWAFCVISLASLCCWEQAEGRKALSVLRCHECFILVFLKDPTVWGGYWDQRERDGDTHPPLPLPELPSEQPCLPGWEHYKLSGLGTSTLWMIQAVLELQKE